MQSSDSKPDDTLRAQLRAVPLPKDLLPRLRKVALLDDASLDAAICNVAGPSPQGIKPPLVPGFPLDMYVRNHVHPFDLPAAKAKPYRGPRK